MPDDDLVEGRDDLETAADDEMGGGKMSFLDHLDELRRRIVYAVISVGIGFVIAFFFIDDIFNFVMRPDAATAAAGRNAGLHRSDRSVHALHQDCADFRAPARVTGRVHAGLAVCRPRPLCA